MRQNDCPLTSYSDMSAKAPEANEKGTKHPFAMLVLAPFSFAFTGPSARLSAPSAGVSKVSMNLFDNFGRTDGVSKVSMPRPEGVQQPRCCRAKPTAVLAAIAAAALSLCCRPRAHIPPPLPRRDPGIEHAQPAALGAGRQGRLPGAPGPTHAV